MDSDDRGSAGLRAITSRSFLTASLIPLLTIELVLLVLYFATHAWIERKNHDALRAEVSENLREIAEGVAGTVDAQLAGIARDTAALRTITEAFYANPAWEPPPAEVPPRFATSPSGVYYKAADNGGGSLFYGARTVIGPEQREKARRSELLDLPYAAVERASEDIVAVYLNTYDDMNRYVPFIEDVVAQYDPMLHMEEFNFYYLADAAHNPARGVVWTGAYLDPAGKGWMASCIAPVYRGDVLEGVLGVDVTTENFVSGILDRDYPWRAEPMLVDAEGNVLAARPELERRLGGSARVAYTGKPLAEEVLGDLNLLRHPDPRVAEPLRQLLTEPAAARTFIVGESNLMFLRAPIPTTGWTLLLAADEAVVYAPVDALAADTFAVGVGAVGVMLLFYLGFFFYVWSRSRRLADLIAAPIARLTEATARLAAGSATAALPRVSIAEIDQLSANFETMRDDLDESRRRQEQAVREAEASARAKAEFLANMSHEIRTPLNGILGMGKLLAESPLGDEQRRFATAIQRSGEGLLATINDVLDLTKIEAGRVELEVRTFDPNVLVDDLAALYGAEARARGLTFSRVPSIGVPTRLRGDPHRLRQVLGNLLGNAVKFTERGSVTLAVDAEPTPTGARLDFRVTDTGIGIPAERLGSIFDSFVQADGSITRRFGGTGLGLTIARRLVECMGGTLTVQSEPGRGSSFRVTVELPSDPDPAPPPAPARATPVEGLRVLVVEDNEINLDYLRALLGRAGVDVRCAADGRAGVEAWRREAPDVILMDVQMPVLDGFGATRAIRAAEAGGARVPILALTAHAIAGYGDACREAGMDDYLTKPVRAELLLEAIARWAGRSGQPAPERTPPNEAHPFAAAVESCMGDRALARQLLGMLRDQVVTKVAQVRALLSRGEAAGAVRIAHSLKGSAAQIGVEAVRAAATRLEEACRGGDVGEAQAAVDALDARGTELAGALARWSD